MAKTKKWTADDLLKRLRNRFDGSGYVVLIEIPRYTGGWKHQWIDAAVVSLWTSKGHYRAAFEIKIGRQDFLKELANPDKSAWVRDIFHEFWFVAPRGLIDKEELPEGVGLMVPRGETLQIVRAASRKEEIETDQLLVGCLLRAAVREMEHREREAERMALKNSRDYQRAMHWMKAIQKFCDERHVIGYPNSPEEALDCLRKATSDQKDESDKRCIVDIIRGFQHRMLRLLDEFVPLAYVGLLETDKDGQRMMSLYGSGKEEAFKRAEDDKRSFDWEQSVKWLEGRARALLKMRKTK